VSMLPRAPAGPEARLDLGAAVEAAAAVQPISVSAEHKSAVLEFIERRLEQLLVDAGVQVGAAPVQRVPGAGGIGGCHACGGIQWYRMQCSGLRGVAGAWM